MTSSRIFFTRLHIHVRSRASTSLETRATMVDITTNHVVTRVFLILEKGKEVHKKAKQTTTGTFEYATHHLKASAKDYFSN